MKKTTATKGYRRRFRHSGPPVSIDRMDQGIVDAISEDWERFEQQTRKDRLREALEEMRPPIREFQRDDQTSENRNRQAMPIHSQSDDWHRKPHALWKQGRDRLAFRRFLAAAKAGDFTAQLNLGHFYDLGIGVKRKKSAALRWYEQAYLQGVAAGATNAGIVHRDRGDFETALMWMERGVSLGDADANWEIAKMCFRQRGDIPRTLRYLKQALRAEVGRDITWWSYKAAERFLQRIEGRSVTA